MPRTSGNTSYNRRRVSGGATSVIPTGSLVATAVLTGTGTTKLAGTGALSAHALLSGAGAVKVPGTGTMTVHAVLTGTGSVSLTGTGAMSAHAALTGTGSGGSSTLAITSQGTNHSTTSTLSVTHFTPASGTLVIVSFLDFLNSSNTVSIADSFGDSGGGAWTAFTGSLLTSSGTFSEAYGGWYRLIGTGAGSSAPTITAASFTGGNQQMCVDLITPSGGSITVPQSKVVTASFSTTGSVALTSGPASTSLVWGTAGCTATALTPTVTTAGFTALDLTNASLSVATAYKNTSGPQTTAWSGLSGGQVNFLGSVEIAI